MVSIAAPSQICSQVTLGAPFEKRHAFTKNTPAISRDVNGEPLKIKASSQMQNDSNDLLVMSHLMMELLYENVRCEHSDITLGH